MPSRREERGSALVSVLVVMLVLTLFGLTLAAIVVNTTSTLSRGRSTAQGRAAADAGIAAALAAFKKAQGCTGTVSSITPPVYAATCTASATAVTFLSTGRASDGRPSVVQAVYGYTMAQAFAAKVGQLTFFSGAGTFAPNIVTSSTSDPAKVVVAAGNFQCQSAMNVNLVVKGDFSANYGCAISGSVQAKGNATMNAGSSIGRNLTAGGAATLYSVSSVGGSLSATGDALVYSGSSIGKDLSAGGHVFLDSSSSVGGSLVCGAYIDMSSNSSVGGDLSTAGYARLASGTSVGGNLTSTGFSNVEGTVKGNLASAGYVVTGDNSSIVGSVTAAGTDRTWIHGSVGKDVKAAGPVTSHYNSVVAGDVAAAGTGATEVYGTVTGGLTARGEVLIDYNGRVGGPVTAAGTGSTSVYGRITGGLKVAGTVAIDYNGTVGADVTSSGTGTDNVSGRVTGNLSAGGDVNLPSGSVGGNLTLPPSRNLTPSDAKTRVGGSVSSKSAPAAPSSPSAPASPAEIKVTPPAAPTIPSWQDYGYASADWPGYTVQVLGKTSTWCTARNWATYLATFTVPTVLDATACSGGLREHAAAATEVTIGVNVVVVSSEIDLQYFTFKAASATTPNLWFIVPSAAGATKAYAGVTAGTGGIDLDSTNLGVPALLYTPGRIGYRASTFTGSMYGGSMVFDSAPPGDIKATPMDFPLALFDDSGSTTTPSGTFSVTRLSQREIA
ncbi:MAG TPA: polymer-forming cytoskeletal protein [Propionicimonas sp.]|uniref:polymer-forming cytoskeletal protein n=1 Tax=Propionicimonas sp. TaxID=1955623 RepID=UPI002F420435